MTRRRTVLTLTVWAALLVGARIWGLAVADHASTDLKLSAIPLYGHWRWEITWWLVVPVAVGAALVIALPQLSRRLPWHGVLSAAAVGVIGWSLALQMVDRKWTDIHHRYGMYIHVVDDLGGPGEFLRNYVEFQVSAPIHLQAHPPGLVLGLWGSDAIGLSGVAYENLLAMASVAVAAIAVLAMARDVAGVHFARRAAPFVVLAPAAVWHNNADVIFAGVALAGVALVTLASGRKARSTPADGQGRLMPWALAVGGGTLFGASLLLSYGVALLAVPIAAITLWRRQWLILAVSAIAGLIVVLLPLVWGFWWLDGLETTKVRYDAGVASVRPYWYFLVGNLAVFAAAIGPAVATGLAWLRDHRAWLVVGSGLAIVALADISGMSKAETERIWQPFIPLVLLAGAALKPATRWLIAQVVMTVVLQAALRTPW